jgi:hypothetical protein
LNTASLGLPLRRALTALCAELELWRAGRAGPPNYDLVGADNRATASDQHVQPRSTAHPAAAVHRPRSMIARCGLLAI